MATTKVRYNQIKTGLPAGGDVNYNDVSLLLHMNGTDGSTTFTDSSSTNKSVTVVGSADISTDKFKFGGSSYNCNLGNGNSIYLNNSGGVFGFSGQNYWTIETWFYRTATGNQTLMSNYGNSSTGWTIQIGSEKLIINLSGDGNDIEGTTTLSTNTWHHIALVNNNGTYTAYLNGTSEGAKTGSVNLTGGSRLAIGNFPYGGGFTQTGPGYMDEIRITNNIARYTSDFSIPTEEFGAFQSNEGKKMVVGSNGNIDLQ